MKKKIRFLGLFLTLSALAMGLLLQGCGTRGDRDYRTSADSVPVSRVARTYRVLVMGTDKTANLTDTLFLFAVNGEAGEAKILQIPRDTYANYTQNDYKKINGALNAKGALGMRDMLSRALGVTIDCYLRLDLAALCDIVDAVGGVDVEIPQPMHYTDPEQGLQIDFDAGLTHLSGADAERFIRFRSGYADADLGRLEAQRLFLDAFAKKCATLSGKEVFHLVTLVLTRVQSDVSFPDAWRIVEAMNACKTEQIAMATLPGQAVQGTSGAWYYCVRRADAILFVNEYLMPQPAVTDATFDPDFLFDRRDHAEFHKIYTSP